MKTADQHLRLIAIPAALAFAIAGCDKDPASTQKDDTSTPTAKVAAAPQATAPVATAPVASAPSASGLASAVAGEKKPAAPVAGKSKGTASTLTTAAEANAVQGPSRPDSGAAVLDLTFDPADGLDLGQMQPGVPKTGVVKLTNNGTNSVQIKKAVASCGCTTPNWPRGPIGPGETAEIEITLKPTLKQGQKLNKRVTLQMMAGPPQVIKVGGEVGLFVKIAPDFLDSAKQDGPGQGAVTLTSADEIPFTVVKADPAVLSGIGGDKSLSHEMAVDWAAWEEAGRRPIIKLTTDHPNAPELSITVRRAITRDKPLPPPRNLQQFPISKLVIATQGGDADGVAAAIAAGEEIDTPSMGGMTSLHWASKNGNSKIVNLLLGGGADVNSRNKVGKTPVVMAAESGNLEVVEILVGKGADINSVDEIGGTPLLWAAALSKNPATVAYLIEKGADVNIIDTNGMTPLIWAAGIGRPEAVSVLVENGADLEIVEINQKETALMRAARIGDPQSLMALVAAKPDLETTNLLGQSAVIIAASAAPVEKIAMLVDAGADLGIRDTRNWSVLDHARARTDSNRTAVIEYLEAKVPPAIKSSKPAGG
jgi:ankyrin repeat protein